MKLFGRTWTAIDLMFFSLGALLAILAIIEVSRQGAEPITSPDLAPYEQKATP